MSTLFKLLGGLFFLAGIVWAAYIVAGVATHAEGYSTMTGLIPGLAFHAVSLFAAVVFMGLGFKARKLRIVEQHN